MTAEGAPDPQVALGVARIRRSVESLVLVTLAFVQAPGFVAADTKLDLYVDPWRFLGRALNLWDPQAAAGRLQNQAYGYLFPMGPFFEIGHLLGLQPWVTQRLWWCVVVLVAYHGLRVLAERMEVGNERSRMLAAFAYALAPRMLGGLGAVSSEIWPMAIAPWVLVPLVRVAPGGERRAAARSAMAVLAVGGINAVATAAVLPLPVLWLLTRRRNLRLLAWWCLGTILASVWWVVPLLTLGQYSPPFLNWIESASVTTAGASMTEALRGTTQWIAGLTGSRGPQWPAGWVVLTSRATVVLGLLLAAVGLWGVQQAPRRWRTFARSGLAVGLVLVTLGHVGGSSGLFALEVQQALDRSLAALRNTHKFEPILRIVLCLGLAQAVTSLPDRLAGLGVRVRHGTFAAAVGALVVGLAAPAALIGVSQRGPFTGIPTYWQDAAQWLAQHPDGGRTIVVPGAMAATSVWGDPRDEPLQALAGQPWMVRDAVPLGSADATRLLNDVEARLATGYGGAQLSSTLSRLGVSRVLIRSDLDWRATGAPAPVVVRSAVSSTGAASVASFGPQFGGDTSSTLVRDSGIDRPMAAIEIFDLSGGTVGPRLVPGPSVRLTSGGAEGDSLLVGALSAVTSVLSSDSASVAALTAVGLAPESVLTDTLQRRDASFAAVRNNYGSPLSASAQYSGSRPVHDWLPEWLPGSGPGLSGVQTVKDVTGAVSVTASSSLTQPSLGQQRDLSTAPENAFDASADTAWGSSGYQPVGQWVQVRWGSAVQLPSQVDAVFDMASGADIAAVTVTTDSGSARTAVSSPTTTPGGDPSRFVVPVDLPSGPSRSLRLTIDEVRPGSHPGVRVLDIGAGRLPRVQVWLSMPAAPTAAVAGVAMHATVNDRPGCVTDQDGVPRCQPDAAMPSEEQSAMRRIFSLPGATSFTVAGTVVPVPSPGLAKLLQRPDGVKVAASSQWLASPSVGPWEALDGDPRSYWAADPHDQAPTITVTFPRQETVTRLRIDTATGVSGSAPTKVRVTMRAHSYESLVSADGSIEVPTTTTRALSVTVLAARTVSTTDGYTTRALPVVIGDVEIDGRHGSLVPPLGSDLEVAVPCGFGPVVQIDGRSYPTRVVGTRADTVSDGALALASCSKVDLGPGAHYFQVLASAEFAARTISMEAGGAAPASPAQMLTATRWGATSRVVTLPHQPLTAPAILAVAENANAGWVAELGGVRLAPLTVDGWSQGWVVPAGAAGTVHLTFEPQRAYAVGLWLGLVAAVVVLVAAAPAARRRRAGPNRAAPPVLAAVRRRPGTELAGVLSAIGVVMWCAGWAVVPAMVVALAARVVRPRELVIGSIVVTWVSVAAWAPWPDVGASNRGWLAQSLASALVLLILMPTEWVSGRRVREPRRARARSETGPTAE